MPGQHLEVVFDNVVAEKQFRTFGKLGKPPQRFRQFPLLAAPGVGFRRVGADRADRIDGVNPFEVD